MRSYVDGTAESGARLLPSVHHRKSAVVNLNLPELQGFWGFMEVRIAAGMLKQKGLWCQ